MDNKIKNILKIISIFSLAIEAENAAERIDTYPDFTSLPNRALEQEASRLKRITENFTDNGNTNDTLALYHKLITLEDYITNAKRRAIEHLTSWINKDLMDGNNNFIAEKVVNVAGFEKDKKKVEFIHSHRLCGEPFNNDSMPINRTKDAFIKALTAHINAVKPTDLIKDYKISEPADRSFNSLGKLISDFSDALAIEINDWLNTLLKNKNEPFLDQIVPCKNSVSKVINGSNEANRPKDRKIESFQKKMSEILKQQY